jgi:hypothetical protein
MLQTSKPPTESKPGCDEIASKITVEPKAKIDPSAGVKLALGPYAELGGVDSVVKVAFDTLAGIIAVLPLESTLSNSELVMLIWQVPDLTMLKVKVTKLPVPVAPTFDSRIELRLSSTPSVLSAGTGTNIVLPADLRNGPSTGESCNCRILGSQAKLTVHPQRFVTPLIWSPTVNVLPTARFEPEITEGLKPTTAACVAAPLRKRKGDVATRTVNTAISRIFVGFVQLPPHQTQDNIWKPADCSGQTGTPPAVGLLDKTFTYTVAAPTKAHVGIVTLADTVFPVMVFELIIWVVMGTLALS